MKRRFFEWLEALDPGVRIAMRGSLVPWFGTAAVAALLIAICGLAPAVASYFELDVEAAVTVWLVAFGCGIGGTWLDGKLEFPPLVYGISYLATCGLVVLFSAALVSLSRPPGSAIFAAVFILTAAFYGHMHRSSFRLPFGLLCVAFALCGALLLDTSRESWPVFGVAGPAALGANWLLGTMAYRTQRSRKQSESLRAAVQAQILDERSRDVSRLSGAMMHVLQTTHDASNALSAALLNAETLRKSAEARRRGEIVDVDEHAAASDLTEQLARLRKLVEETRKVGHRGDAAAQPPTEVAPLPVVSDVLRELRSFFPAVRFHATGTAPSVRLLVSGGTDSLYRILENLVLNACQGHGAHGARDVEIRIEHATTVGSVAIRVIDDGPGFTEAQLAGPIIGLQSEKPDGSGLGLYTAERLARASGGSITRENRPSGGAVVTVFLAGVAPS